MKNPIQTQALSAIIETLVEVGGDVAEGTLYASVCGKISLNDFQTIIQVGKNLGYLERGSFAYNVRASQKAKETFAAIWKQEGRDEKTGLAPLGV